LLGKLDHAAIQEKWSGEWERSRVYEFDARSKKPVYSIDSPPPFTSGALHMGHMLSYAYFDFAARYKRMRGFEVYYPQGWDCQGFPTEVKVRAKFPQASREEFLAAAHEFTEANIAKMKSQMRAMGFSPDWRFEYKTMSDDYHRRVQFSLLKMFKEGLVYRAKHPVLWCPKCASAIAKAETEDKERETRLNFVYFSVAKPGSVKAGKEKRFAAAGEKVVIATTRPEFLHACVAVAVHPDDLRFSELVGAELEVPLFKQRVRVIADKDVDPSFGTGIVMICTFGDKQDVVWAYRLGLRVVEALDERGRLINAGEYDGMKVKDAREKILAALRANELFERDEPLAQSVKTHDRCGGETEFLPSFQWFIKLKGAADEVVAAGREMKWVPPFTLQYLVDWAQGLEWDWVISRQNVFGTPLPFWYCEKCGEIHVPEEKSLPVDPAKEKHSSGKCKNCGGALRGEQSVCDCWVDSSITPLVIARWPEDEAFTKKVYPATLRPQGLEIIRTWAFYTIYRCLKLTGKPPFRELLINGSVLGTDGKKMSKSAGNFEDPEVLLRKYPADALRQWAALSGAFAKDRPFSYKDVEFAKSFLTKLWNAARFVESAAQDFDKRKTANSVKPELVDQWLLAKCDACVAECTRALDEYDYFAAINAVHQFFWRDFCDYYIEDVKHRIYSEAGEAKELREAAQYALRAALEKTLLLLAPFASFTAEEIYSSLYAEKGGKGGKNEKSESIHAQAWPKAERKTDERVTKIIDLMHLVLGEIRKFKAVKGLALNAPLARVTVRCSEAQARDLADVVGEIKAIAKVGVVAVEKNAAGDSAASEGLIVECGK
jgi:valyl-tRNA synthetase